MTSRTAVTMSYPELPNNLVSAANGVDHAHRVAGDGGVPLVSLQHFRGLAGLIPRATVKLYPDAAHGFLFQHHAEFAGDVGEFLARASERKAA
jgi:pimeloyl-ACP methyl ester carboxylesterase